MTSATSPARPAKAATAEAEHLKAMYALEDDPLNDPLGDPLAAYRETLKEYPLLGWAHHQVLKRTERYILTDMARHLVWVDGEYRCYLSVKELDGISGIRSLRPLKRLEDQGLIARRKGPHPETGAMCRYHVILVDNGR